MCFHNAINTDKQSLEKKYKKKLKASATFNPIFHANAFDFLTWPIISSAHQEIEIMNWGLIPRWISSPQDAHDIKSKTLNARIETINEKASFKNAKRCIVPSTGFFEWQTVGIKKIPYYIFLPESPIFSMAGIYDTWIDEKGNPQRTFSILTTEANPLMQKIHNTKKRMPVILSSENENTWINNEIQAKTLQKPFDEKRMAAYTIGSIISSKNHNSIDVNKPQTIEIQEQLSLF
jgi:putative SOS response-associated peptidase YedK